MSPPNDEGSKINGFILKLFNDIISTTEIIWHSVREDDQEQSAGKDGEPVNCIHLERQENNKMFPSGW